MIKSEHSQIESQVSFATTVAVRVHPSTAKTAASQVTHQHTTLDRRDVTHRKEEAERQERERRTWLMILGFPSYVYFEMIWGIVQVWGWSGSPKSVLFKRVLLVTDVDVDVEGDDVE